MHQSILPTTPFGRRPASLGHVASQLVARKAVEAAGAGAPSNQPQAVHKWRLFRTLTEIRRRLGVSDRALGVLNALLTFHPETALSLAAGGEGEDGEPQGLVVFPSNRSLAMRANGMDDRTLRRHLAALADAGLIIRRDSPNGKRYARRAGEGAPAQAFGFDLTPLAARAAEFEAAADEARRDAREVRTLREAISLRRRDVLKLVALGLDEGLPGDWEALRLRFMGIARPLRSGLQLGTLREMAHDLGELAAEAEKLLAKSSAAQEMTGDDGDFDRHESSSNPHNIPDFEPAFKNAGGGIETKAQETPLPLALVLEACPDIASYRPEARRIRGWTEFIAAAQAVRPMLGISPSAWGEAVAALGEPTAAITLAAVLQRSEFSSEATTAVNPDGRATITVNGSPAIRSPGGYLRALTEQAAAAAFSPGPLLMALIGQRLKRARGE